tara:strand:+ start:786 stop:977 length:192 start_codon:yes stop_codon:yes gene_type:complete
LIWLKLKDLEHSATWDTDPTDLAGRPISIYAEEITNAVWWRIGYTHERTSEHVPVEANSFIEI